MADSTNILLDGDLCSFSPFTFMQGLELMCLPVCILHIIVSGLRSGCFGLANIILVSGFSTLLVDRNKF